MADDHRGDAIRGQQRALKRALHERQSDERERQAVEADTAEDAKIARLRELRLAKEAAERTG